MPIFNGKNNVSLRSERTPYKTIPQPFNLTQSKTNKSVQEHEPISVSSFLNSILKATLNFIKNKCRLRLVYQYHNFLLIKKDLS